jgi:hypothetical protein
MQLRSITQDSAGQVLENKSAMKSTKIGNAEVFLPLLATHCPWHCEAGLTQSFEHPRDFSLLLLNYVAFCSDSDFLHSS